MHIVVNGSDCQTEAKTVAELLSERHLDPSKLVAELNGLIVARNDFAQTALKPDDSIELVQFVGGG